jgi:ribosomal protein S18 acetylase RimI-like enzyme
VPDVLATLEEYYDTAPRAGADAVQVGPFTLFVRNHPQGWHYSARPRFGLGLDEPVTSADVQAVRARQRELGVPESLEWVHGTTPGLLEAAALQDSPAAFGSTYRRELGHSEQDWRAGLEDPDRVAVLASLDGRTVGIAGGYPDRPGLLHVVAMWVDPSVRGRGIAHRLLDALAGQAAGRDRTLHLDVALSNPSARRSYQRYGFVATGETRPLRPGSADLVERMLLERTPT